jgi:hypothetical protein
VDDEGYKEAKVRLATSDLICSPYTYKASFRPMGFESREIGLYQDMHGQAYLLSEDASDDKRAPKTAGSRLIST